MVLLPSKDLPLGMKCPDFNLMGVDGGTHSLQTLAHKKALVIVVMCVHCPYVQAIEDDIIRLQEEFEFEGIQFVGINPNDAVQYPDDSFDGMRKRAEEMGYNFLYLRDEDQSVSKALQAVCTPDIYLFDEKRELYFHGAIKNLEYAIEDLLDEEPAMEGLEPSQGCSIKWKE